MQARWRCAAKEIVVGEEEVKVEVEDVRVDARTGDGGAGTDD